MQDPVYGDKWREAMNTEWNNLFDTGAFTWIKRSDCVRGIAPLPCHVVCKYKALSKRFKCRVVINGSRQVAGTYGETYAATVAASLVRLILCIGVHFSWDIRVLDVKGAFLYSPLPDGQTIYLLPPKGFEKPGHLIKLERSSYGLKEAPALWSKLLHSSLFEYGLSQSQHDASVFFSKERQLFCAIHVDDITVTGPDDRLDDFERFLRSKFELSSGGTISDLLGMEVKYSRTSGHLELHQTKKVKP